MRSPARRLTGGTKADTYSRTMETTMSFPPKAHWPPRDLYDWSMAAVGVAAVVVFVWAAVRMLNG